MPFVALERLDMGTGLREPGDLVPEAEGWDPRTQDAYLSVRRIKRVTDEEAREVGKPGDPRPYPEGFREEQPPIPGPAGPDEPPPPQADETGQAGTPGQGDQPPPDGSQGSGQGDDGPSGGAAKPKARSSVKTKAPARRRAPARKGAKARV